jgi:pimeloyl-ACP methyl ester carboxylesterase
MPAGKRLKSVRSRRKFLVAAGVVAVALTGAPFIVSALRKRPTGWSLSERERVATLETEFGPVAYFVPRDPRHVVVMAHGYPWPDGWLFGPFLLNYARCAVRRWIEFATANSAILLAPALGAGGFGGYREMFGVEIDADEFVNRLIDFSAKPLLHDFDGRFVLHGHSAGGQFAARYVVAHPDRLLHAVLSAPSTYPFPDSAIPWPNGMGTVTRGAESGRRRGTAFTPDARGCLRAATDTPITVLVGSRDTTTRPGPPDEPGTTRLERAIAWVQAMTQLPASVGRASTVKLEIAPGLEHDEAAIAIPAQRILADSFASALPKL